ncbi:excinuclease Cho [Buttiauxella warmboldiae]|uniref:Excinuclease cho n=1 Tax=Buttiauxella warmboldiae TaxID=82993 RepID=A0A3N5DU17_9ENTR|nr:excinuclease Cho [Buttiauxella warmboldiae]RPH30671.1 excinuclease Cho [Buttiauxella warmboldiae]
MPLPYQYPEHLRYTLETLPSKPGVYIFYGSDRTFPLYIGKSINIRSRVQSHFRTESEAKLLHMTTHIDFHPTMGEIGALLLESQLIKNQSPLFNKRLRIARRLCALRITEKTTQFVFSNEADFTQADDLFGLFKTKRAAIEQIRELADQQRLCYGVLGLEKLSAGRACFRYSLGKCGGACCGVESVAAHQHRLRESLESLKVRSWPYPGRIAIEEKSGDLAEYHVLSNWLYLGTVTSPEAGKSMITPPAYFDRDSYKILCRYVFPREGLKIIELDQ